MSDRAFDRLLKEIRSCRECAHALPHEPRPVIRAKRSARLCIAGQAPGTRVHKSGKPFTDPSGDRLRDWMGVNEDQFYDESKIAIVPMGFCFPGLDDKGGDLPPRKECAELWRGQVMDNLSNVEVTLLVGQYAQKWHLGKKRHKTLTETVAHWRDYLPRFLPLPHPSWRNNAWIKKNPWFETDLLPELRRIVTKALK